MKPRSLRLRPLFLFLVVLALATPAFAGTGGPDMPWNTPLGNLLDSLTGTTARILGGLALAITGAIWAFTRHESGGQKLMAAILGIAIIFGAPQVIDALGFAGAVLPTLPH